MKNYIKSALVSLFIGILVLSCKSVSPSFKQESFKAQLQTLFPTAEITPLNASDHFKEAYQLVLNQPLDHKNPSKGTFKQYVYVSNADISAPTVLITEGYNATYKTYELSTILHANQVMVEYRFYGKSQPNPIPWEYLTNDEAIEDYHAIVTKLKHLYKNKWISTGISKGGETTLIYKYKYPNDVAVAVPYVAPLINTPEDPRIWEFMNSVGTANCRAKIEIFQQSVLKNRDSIMPLMKAFAAQQHMKFTQISFNETIEYAVLEFPFSFWQWGGKCDEIPNAEASAETLFKYLNKVIPISFYNDQTYEELLPSYYQHMIELGYYGFDFTPVKNLLQAVKSTSNSRFAPKLSNLTYNPNYIKKVRDFVEDKGKHILYIYGGNDPWSGACAPQPKPHVDALKMVLKEGDHSTRISNFSQQDQQLIYNTLQRWLGRHIKIYPLKQN